MTLTTDQVWELIADALRDAGERAPSRELAKMRKFLEELGAGMGKPSRLRLLRRMLEHQVAQSK